MVGKRCLPIWSRFHVSNCYVTHSTKNRHWGSSGAICLSVTTPWGGCWFDSQKSCDLWPLEMCSWRVSNYHIIYIDMSQKFILTVRLLRKSDVPLLVRNCMEFWKAHRSERRLETNFFLQLVFLEDGLWRWIPLFFMFHNTIVLCWSSHETWILTRLNIKWYFLRSRFPETPWNAKAKVEWHIWKKTASTASFSTSIAAEYPQNSYDRSGVRSSKHICPPGGSSAKRSDSFGRSLLWRFLDTIQWRDKKGDHGATLQGTTYVSSSNLSSNITWFYGEF